jgi:hypothetical protein
MATSALQRLMVVLAVYAATFVPTELFAQTPPQVVSKVSCPGCRIMLRPVVTLGDADGPGMLESEAHEVTIDSRGRYYVSGGPAPYFWVFDRDGKVLRRIGSRGKGPGEFLLVSGILTAQGDTLHVFDGDQARLSIFSPGYELVRTVNLGHSR